ncbi:MAG: hypothetical protein GF308_12075 [Candidatus Heimdallarchaeota archaeon]|nr:hypothetical protein [Candidatus Heimdallarchaeota archaeon]
MLDLPDDIAFRVQGNMVIVPKELQTGTEEAEKAIDELLARFEEYKRQTRGKV